VTRPPICLRDRSAGSMRVDRSTLIDLVVSVVSDHCRLVETGVDVGASTRLFGRDGLLDSLGLVSVVVEVEQRLSDLGISLMDDRAMSQERSPFQSPETLADYILALLSERPRR